MGARKIVSQRIETLRKDEGMTQEDFAVVLGMEGKRGRSTVNNWELSAVQIKSDDLTIIGKTFGVSVDWLLGLTEDKSLDKDLNISEKTTGLSEKAIKKLQTYKRVGLLSKLIEDEEFKNLFDSICVLEDIAKESERECANLLADQGQSPESVIATHYEYLVMRKLESDIKDSFARMLARIANTSSKVFDEADKTFSEGLKIESGVF